MQILSTIRHAKPQLPFLGSHSAKTTALGCSYPPPIKALATIRALNGFADFAYPHENEFDCAILLLAAKHGQTFLPGFDRRFVNAIELEELAVSLADLLFDVIIPEVSSEAKGAVRLFVQGNVVRAFELDDVIAFGFVFVITPGLRVLELG